MPALRPLADCRLYTFVDTAYLNGRDPVEVARQLCDGGSDIIQLRAKTSPRDQLLSIARKILEVTTAAGVWLVINDYPYLAGEIGAPMAHLGQEDFFDAGRKHVSSVQVTRDLQIGLSTHSPEQAGRAIAAGAAYIAIGPVYATGTKPTAKTLTLEYVRWAAANVRIPWFAIGGINEKTIDAVMEAGAKRVCIVSAILQAPDIRKSCESFRARLGS